MGKQVFMSFLICILIPTCIGVYFFLYQDLQENGMLPFSNDETIVEDESVASDLPEDGVKEIASDDKQTEGNEPLIKDANITKLDHEDLGEPMDDIDYAAVQQEMENQDQEDADHVRVQVITKDAAGNVIDERYETLDGVKIVQPNSDRHLEIVAVEFARMHFDFTTKHVYFSGKLVSRDEQYAKVVVTKTASNDLFQKEKFNVILEMTDGKPRPISLQQVDS